PGQRINPKKPARDRRSIRRTRSYDRAPCRTKNCRRKVEADRAQSCTPRTRTNPKRITMQLVQATRDALLKPLSTVAGIVERRNTLPILANILLRKEGKNVAFIATDLEVQITTHAEFGIGD